MINKSNQKPFGNFYKNKRVLVTGHTGFKGTWLVKWLQILDANVMGIGLNPDYDNSLFAITQLSKSISHQILDIRNKNLVSEYIQKHQPQVIFHLAAQALVRQSYREPLLTLETNVMGTANLLQAVKKSYYTKDSPCRIVIVTSDKCYENKETCYAYREDDPIGGHDVYSMSKGATELVVSSWRRSFFPNNGESKNYVHIATARAGNVIGGGDWSKDRIVVDCIKSLMKQLEIPVRNPRSMRPWQHVLEPLSGYLQLGSCLGTETNNEKSYSSAWNFGPDHNSTRSVSELCDTLISHWGGGNWKDESHLANPHEAQYLKLAVEKAHHYLNWHPVWNFERSIKETVDWYRLAYDSKFDYKVLREKTEDQIMQYTADAKKKSLRWS